MSKNPYDLGSQIRFRILPKKRGLFRLWSRLKGLVTDISSIIKIKSFNWTINTTKKKNKKTMQLCADISLAGKRSLFRRGNVCSRFVNTKVSSISSHRNKKKTCQKSTASKREWRSRRRINYQKWTLRKSKQKSILAFVEKRQPWTTRAWIAVNVAQGKSWKFGTCSRLWDGAKIKTKAIFILSASVNIICGRY